MAITRVQFKVGGGDASQGTSVATGNFGSSCTSGNYILVAIRNATNSLTGISDTLSTSYASAVSKNTQNPNLWLYYGILTGSGTNSVTCTFSSTSYVWVFGIEVSGLASSSALDITDSHTGTGVTDIVSGSLTTNQADEYVMYAVSQNNFAIYTAGTSFTIVDGTVPTNANDFGGVQEWITSSALSAVTAHITSNDTNDNTVVVATFKGAAAGGATTPRFLPLLGTGA